MVPPIFIKKKKKGMAYSKINYIPKVSDLWVEQNKIAMTSDLVNIFSLHKKKIHTHKKHFHQYSYT